MTPNGGPPTLRECREMMKTTGRYMTHFEVGEIQRMAYRLTDEALERDEKRMAALMELFKFTESASKIYLNPYIADHVRREGLERLGKQVEACIQAGVASRWLTPEEEEKAKPTA